MTNPKNIRVRVDGRDVVFRRLPPKSLRSLGSRWSAMVTLDDLMTTLAHTARRKGRIFSRSSATSAMVSEDGRRELLAFLKRRHRQVAAVALSDGTIHCAGLILRQHESDTHFGVYQGALDGPLVVPQGQLLGRRGLLQFDLIPVQRESVIEVACEFLHRELGLAASRAAVLQKLERLSLDDPAAWDLLAHGRTDGVFQLESAAMRRVLRRYKPRSLDELTAVAMQRSAAGQRERVTCHALRAYQCAYLKANYPQQYGRALTACTGPATPNEATR